MDMSIKAVEYRVIRWVLLEGIEKEDAVRRIYGSNFGMLPTADLCILGKQWAKKRKKGCVWMKRPKTP